LGQVLLQATVIGAYFKLKISFFFQCTVNGIDYQPTIASDNKKKAKSNAAIVALQELGMMAKDPNNPL
jgi:hypothetical protein